MSSPLFHTVVTDLTVCTFSTANSPSSYETDTQVWHRIEKELYLGASPRTAWLYVALADGRELAVEDLVVMDVRVGVPPPASDLGCNWEPRLGGIWLLRGKFADVGEKAVTEVDVLFGTDAVDPRPQWTLMQSPLRLDGQPQVPSARLSVLHGRAERGANDRPVLRVREDGTFRVVQISDAHMVTGVGICKDAIDAYGNNLPESEADPLTVTFIANILDAEKPDLVVLTGDQLHHDIPDSQSALFKVVAPMIERSIPFVAVFGNHDSEGVNALPRTAQMSILQSMPFSLCDPGPQQVDGVGNLFVEILAPAPSQLPLSTLYFLDSHGQKASDTQSPDYDCIKPSQIDWFTNTSQARRLARTSGDSINRPHISMAFIHIPVPEFGEQHLRIHSGHRREPSEGPSFNSRFYDALAKEGISALGCGHDHVNDFCALLPPEGPHDSNATPQPGPWLCYGGGSGFGGYCSYGKRRFHRRARVWQLDTMAGCLTTWKRVEYNLDRIDELVLVENGAVIDPDQGSCSSMAINLAQ